MRLVLCLATTLIACLLFTAGHAIDFPPLGDRYANIPEEAEDAYRSLKRLEARTEIGVNYVNYSRAIGDTFVDVKMFLESREAKNLPELTFVLGNAMDCYREVNRLWGIKVSSDSAIEKYKASETLLTAQPMLWRVAATNLSGAKAILEAEPGELEAAQKLITAGSDSLTLEGALQAAIDEEIRLCRELRAKKTGCPVPPKVINSDLEDRLFPDGRIDDSFAAGSMTSRLTRIFDEVPPASEEGSVDILASGKKHGMVSVFRFDDPQVTAKAFDALTKNLASATRKPFKGLGNRAEVSDQAAVFQRGNLIAYTQGSVPQGLMLSMLAAIDNRIREAFGEGEAFAEPAGDPPDAPVDRPMVTATKPTPPPVSVPAEVVPQNPFTDVLYQTGDLEGVTASGLRESLPVMMTGITGANTVGSVDLKAGGRTRGGVTGMIFADAGKARLAYNSIAGGFSKSATTVDGLGDLAKVSTMSAISMTDLIFLHDDTVIHARYPTPESQTAISLGRRVLARLTGEEVDVGVEDAGGSQLADLLLADGDLAAGVDPGTFMEKRHPEFEGLPSPTAGGMYSLTAAGAPYGTIAALEYDDIQAAREIFNTWTAKPRPTARVSRVSGLGSKSFRRQTRSGVEFYFFRDRFVVFASGPSSSEKDLLRVARRIDSRIRQARAEAGVE